MMQLTDNVKLNVSGFFSIIDQNNKIILAKKNLVVNTAKTIMANALVGSPADDFIAYISFGNPSGGPSAPVITNTSLENQIYQTPVSYQSQSVPYFEDQTENNGSVTQSGSVIFSGVINEDEDFEATEAGLFSIKEFMFSRVIFDTITKSPGDIWLVKWKLQLSLS